MKRIPFYAVMLLSFALLLNSCSKDTVGPGTDPDPNPNPNPPATELIFPKKEMRAAWIATVWSIDWPTSREVAAQKKQYTDLLDRLKQLKFNKLEAQFVVKSHNF